MALPTEDGVAQRGICPRIIVDGTAVIESTWASSEVFLLPDLRETHASLMSVGSSVCAEMGAPDIQQLMSRSIADDDEQRFPGDTTRAGTEQSREPHLMVYERDDDGYHTSCLTPDPSPSYSSLSVLILQETELAMSEVASLLTGSDFSSPHHPPSLFNFGQSLMPEPTPRRCHRSTTPRHELQRRPSVPAPTPRRYTRPVDSFLLQHGRSAHNETRKRPSPIPEQVKVRLPPLRNNLVQTPTPIAMAQSPRVQHRNCGYLCENDGPGTHQTR